ncbi:MAG: 2-dehydropantoate 2-reductase [Candidatus Melainabacteria bacterium]|nr:2-dehydropantoate 2-reductase [Candidatus Melainabacteria bacterium]
MKILVLGAGATGGYFGGRLLEAGADVTFLVRAARAERLRRDGLVVKSRFGDLHHKEISVIEKAENFYDLIILSCKAYDLDSAMQAIAPAVGADSMILPLLNGMQHLDVLKAKFTEENVLGGCCIISSELDEEGRIIHFNANHSLRYGELSGIMSERIQELEELISPCRFTSQASFAIVQDMWEKWVLIASLAALTTMMRATVGEVAKSPFGTEIAKQLADECLAVLRAQGFEPEQSFVDSTHSRLVDASSSLTASMLRDMERGNRVEAQQILGDFIERAQLQNIPVPMLQVAYCHVCAYQQRRESKQN